MGRARAESLGGLASCLALLKNHHTGTGDSPRGRRGQGTPLCNPPPSQAEVHCIARDAPDRNLLCLWAEKGPSCSSQLQETCPSAYPPSCWNTGPQHCRPDSRMDYYSASGRSSPEACSLLQAPDSSPTPRTVSTAPSATGPGATAPRQNTLPQSVPSPGCGHLLAE